MNEWLVPYLQKLAVQIQDPWFWFGLVGNVCFFGRFLVQWIASERARRSVVPLAFWYMSLFGAAILLIYSFHVVNAVYIIGQTTGFIVYIRNLVLLSRSGAASTGGS